MSNNISCIVCGNENSQFLDNILWYDNESRFDVYKCNECKCHHMNIKEIDKSIYDKIYADPKKVWWYDRYYKYAEEVKKQDNALKRLSDTDHIYWIAYNYLKDKSWLKCLEIWCWLWYLTYAINNTDNSCLWYDLSSESILKAKESFWNDNYFVWDVFEEFKNSTEKFDVIIATELIEHIDDYDSFFSNCKKLCKKNGIILITTPNKDFYSKDAIWVWDLPPVHTTRRSQDTFKYIWKKYWFETNFYVFWKYHNDYNLLYLKLWYNLLNVKVSKPHFNTNGNKNNSFIKRALFWITNFYPIKKISNYICVMLFWKINSSITLWCIYKNNA